MKSLITKVYEGYSGDGEPHKLRLCLALVVSSVIGLFGGALNSSTYPAMALTISVLAGFAFTAIFSGHLLTTNELPEPNSENDRSDLTKLKRLAENFRLRSRYFLIISVLALTLIILLSVELNVQLSGAILVHIPAAVIGLLQQVTPIFEWFLDTSKALVSIAVFFVFFECLYTFYRLSETALAITDTRREYIDSRR